MFCFDKLKCKYKYTYIYKYKFRSECGRSPHSWSFFDSRNSLHRPLLLKMGKLCRFYSIYLIYYSNLFNLHLFHLHRPLILRIETLVVNLFYFISFYLIFLICFPFFYLHWPLFLKMEKLVVKQAKVLFWVN